MGRGGRETETERWKEKRTWEKEWPLGSMQEKSARVRARENTAVG